MKKNILLMICLILPIHISVAGPWQEKRVESILSKMTLQEKVGMIHAGRMFSTSGVERLGVPCVWMSDGPHGVRWEGQDNGWKPIGWEKNNDACSYLPALSALAATWNRDLARRYGSVIGRESKARGKHIQLAPGINITRTPLNGRTWEYFSEDPFLTKELAVPYIKAVQKEGVAACVKHFALNTQADDQYWISSEVGERALREIYLPAFEAAIKEAGSMAVMPAYNKVRGKWCSENGYLLDTVLRKEWGFDGVVVSDWNGVHSTVAAALAGTDIEMGTAVKTNGFYDFDRYYFADPLMEKVKDGTVPESVIDEKVRRILRMLLKLGAIGKSPYDTTGMASKLATPAHSEVAGTVAEESFVLLKNKENKLPIEKNANKKIAVIGANAATLFAPGGGSTKLKAKYEISVLDGLKKYLGDDAEIRFAPGYRILNRQFTPAVHKFTNEFDMDFPELVEDAVKLAKESDLVLYVGGLTHEHGMDCEGYDRPDLKLPYRQDELIARVQEANPNMVVVLMAGSPVEMGFWYEKTDAVLQCSFLGMEGGNALAKVLFGDVNPSGKLSNTWPRRLSDCPDHVFGDYPGDGKKVEFKEGIFVGYRYYSTFDIDPEFEFGYGLSYTTFSYSDLKVKSSGNGRVKVKFKIRNTGNREGKETAQVYVSHLNSPVCRPEIELKGFEKIRLKPGEIKTVRIMLDERSFKFWDEINSCWSDGRGDFEIKIGSSSKRIKLIKQVSI